MIANPELRGRIEEIYQTVPSAYRIHVVTSGTGLPKEAEIKLDNFVNLLGGPSAEFCRWELEDLPRLQDAFYPRNLPTIEDPIVFDIDFPPYQVRAANHDSYLFHSQGKVLAMLYVKHGEQLLQQNIRVYQGNGATNSLIRKTATLPAEAQNFFHYNNGVTLLCETAQWEFTKKLTLKKAQVVNGGQTIRVLHDAHNANELQKSVVVPIRVITAQGDREFASNVAVNLNNQIQIEPSFLRSNDASVVQLSSALMSMGWYLERREGEIDTLSSPERKAIESKIGGTLSEKIIRLKEGLRRMLRHT
jgi:AIPR protein